MKQHNLFAVLLLAATACGSNPSSDPGGGTHTLLVVGSADNEGGNAHLRVTVQRANQAVIDATVKMSSDLGDTALVHIGQGVYTAVGAGWGKSYTVQVNAGTDELHGTVLAPEPAPISTPKPSVAFDVRATTTTTLVWSGALADSVRVQADHLDWGPAQDPGQITVSNTIFTAASYDVDVDRTDKILLTGGIVGSQLTASIGTRTSLLIANPF